MVLGIDFGYYSVKVAVLNSDKIHILGEKKLVEDYTAFDPEKMEASHWVSAFQSLCENLNINPKKMDSFFVHNATPDFLFIRPSGNPIDAKGFEQMITGDIVQEKAEITKIHRFEFLSENIVMCIFTLGSKFTYKGTPNDDLPTVTSIFKKVNNVWKIHWMQRSTGNSDLSLWD